MKIFIDTNIFLDLILKRPNYQEALIILNSVEKGIFEGAILDITMLNIDYIAKKQVQDVKSFLNIVNSLFQVIGLDNHTIKEALEMSQNDLEDTLQYLACIKSKCSLIITNDTNFHKNTKQDIEILSSKNFLDKYFQ